MSRFPVNATITPSLRIEREVFRDLSQTIGHFDERARTLWYRMKPSPRPCFNHRILSELRIMQQRIGDLFDKNPDPGIDYLVLASAVPGTFNLGGDLDLFRGLIVSRDRDALVRYATACIDVLHPNAVNLDLPVTTVSLVQGSALGGGFEAALSSNVVIAERGARLGMPEILFNLFPGMGAYQLLCRRINPSQAERMILGGRIYDAAELFECGVVDALAEPGQGEQEVRDWVRRHRRFRNGMAALHEVRQRVLPVCREELMDVCMIWVEAALRLRPRDLKVMDRLVRAQNRLDASPAELIQGIA